MVKTASKKVKAKAIKAKELCKPFDDWDQIEEKEILESWMLRNYGPRCSDYEEDCTVCEMYKLFDKLISHIQEENAVTRNRTWKP